MKNKNYWTMIPDIIEDNENNLQKFKLPKAWDAKYSIKLVWNKKSNHKSVDLLKGCFL